MKNLRFKCIKQANLWREIRTKEGEMKDECEMHPITKCIYANRKEPSFEFWRNLRSEDVPWPSEECINTFFTVFFFTLWQWKSIALMPRIFNCNAKVHVFLINVKITMLYVIKKGQHRAHTHTRSDRLARV